MKNLLCILTGSLMMLLGSSTRNATVPVTNKDSTPKYYTITLSPEGFRLIDSTMRKCYYQIGMPMLHDEVLKAQQNLAIIIQELNYQKQIQDSLAVKKKR